MLAPDGDSGGASQTSWIAVPPSAQYPPVLLTAETGALPLADQSAELLQLGRRARRRPVRDHTRVGYPEHQDRYTTDDVLVHLASLVNTAGRSMITVTAPAPPTFPPGIETAAVSGRSGAG
jgi:hypothetical protein